VSQFFGIVIFVIIAAGMAIHAGLQLPWFFEWIGKLPGDLLIKKQGLTIYVPLTSSILIGIVLSFFLSLFSKK
jgi:hypothetical protein